MPLALPEVTLCAVTSINHELTVRAMNECLRHCSFADAVLISSKPVEASFRVEVVPPFSGIDYAPFICRNLAKYTSSAFNLLVQYDGYIIDPSAWTDEFLNYDYIGAKWPWHPQNRRVGNSGFCLRSKRLLNILAEIDLPPTGTYVDDEYICHTARGWLERKHGIKIAPEEIADRFAYERHTPDRPTFGFHGLFNFYRHLDDAEMKEIPDLIDDIYVPLRTFAEVTIRYYGVQNLNVFSAWYRRLREHVDVAHIRSHLLSTLNNPPFIDGLVRTGEKMIESYSLKRSGTAQA